LRHPVDRLFTVTGQLLSTLATTVYIVVAVAVIVLAEAVEAATAVEAASAGAVEAACGLFVALCVALP
jgi:hypothetical protein